MSINEYNLESKCKMLSLRISKIREHIYLEILINCIIQWVEIRNRPMF